MQSWLGAVARPSQPGRGQVGFGDPLTVTAPGSFGGQERHVVAAGLTDVGSMVVAGIVLLALGLAGVGLWRFGVASRSGDRRTAGTATESEPSAETEPSTPSVETHEAAGQKRVERPDREIIVDILGDHNGRMKQARIVDETGWSKSKVSMLLSEMEEDEEISKLRVGRENIVSLEGNEPEAAGSPFDDE